MVCFNLGLASVAFLQILSFTQHIGSDQDTQLINRLYLVPLTITDRAETPCQLCWVLRVTRDTFYCTDTAHLEFVREVVDSIGKLRKDQYLLMRVSLCQQIKQGAQFCIFGCIPAAVLC